MKKALFLLLALVLSVSFFTVAVSAEDDVPVVDPEVSHSRLDPAEIPEYDGMSYIVLNGNLPDFLLPEISRTVCVRFSPLDALGRTGTGMACLGPETLPAEERGEIGDVRPSGWHTERYDDLIEDRYLYNRCHVIAYMLCGDNNTPENLFTGTRFLNKETMLYFEILVGDYILETGNHVIYRVTPVYRGSDLVAAGVQIEAWSVEDLGAGICFNVFAYNVQPGVLIDYSDGTSRRDPNGPPDESSPDFSVFVMGAVDWTAPAEEIGEDEADKPDYVLNTNTMKFHLPDCKSVGDIMPWNRQDYYGTREALLESGYLPCGACGS